MAKVEIGVEAKVQSTDTSSLEKAVEQSSRRAARRKWNPIDVEAAERDLKRLEQLIADFHKRVGQVAIDAGAPPSGVLTGKPPAVPPPPRPVTTVSAEAAPAGTAGPSGAAGAPRASRRRGPGAYTHMPTGWSVPQHLISGIGGGVGQIGGYGTRGALAGAYRGGVGGGALGLLGGIGIGTLAFGAFKLGQAVHEGYELAKERAATLDTLKRQMGDLGVSFGVLEVTAEHAANGLWLNSKEAAEFAAELNRLRRGAASPMELADETRTAVGISRAYGLDPAVGTQFMGRMLDVDPRQNNRELALLIAEAVQRGGFANQAALFMQAVESFAAATSRLSLSSPNISSYADAFAAMMERRAPGLTADVTAGILGQANSAVARMGGAGEAGWNFIISALNRAGPVLDPIQARALAEGGLFASRDGVFGAKESPLRRYMDDSGIDVDALIGPSGGMTNFEAIRRHLDSFGGNSMLKLEAAQRLFGVGSLSQAAALLNLDASSGGVGNLQRLLERAGVDIRTVNETGIQTLAEVSGAESRQDLDRIATELLKRTGRGAPSEEQREAIRAAQESGDPETLRLELVRIAATLDRQETEASRMIDAMKSIEESQIQVGEKLLTPINTIRDAVAYMAGQGKMGPQELARRMAEAESQERFAGIEAVAKADKEKIEAEYAERVNGVETAVEAHRRARDELRLSLRRGASPDEIESRRSEVKLLWAEVQRQRETLREQMPRLQAERDAKLAEVDKRLAEERKKEDARLAADIEARIKELTGSGGTTPTKAPEPESEPGEAGARLNPGVQPAQESLRERVSQPRFADAIYVPLVEPSPDREARDAAAPSERARAPHRRFAEAASMDAGLRPAEAAEYRPAESGVRALPEEASADERARETTPREARVRFEQRPVDAGVRPAEAAEAALASARVPDDLFERVIQQESGGRHIENGRLIRSPKGALGIAQIMPSTGADPGYGVKPLQNDSEAEHLRLGRDYLDAMLAKYSGDKAKALAAYNAGPGAVDDAIRRGGENWLSLMPAETRRYVPAVLGEELTPLPKQALEQRQAAQDTLNLNINLSGRFDGPGSQVLTPSATTVLTVPRGAGVRSASLAA